MKELLANWEISPQVFNLLLIWGARILAVIAIMVLAFFLANVVQTQTRTRLEKAPFDKTLARLLGTLMRWATLILALMVCLGIFGIQTTSFAAIIGGSALTVGLALQGTLSNVAAGAMLLVFRPYRVDDVVTINAVTGTVWELGLFTTILDTADGRRITVPNNKVFGTTIENVTIRPERRVEITVRVSYAADIDQTRQVLVDAIAALENVTRPPAAFLSELGETAVIWKVRAFCKNEHYGALHEACVRASKLALDAAQIEIAYPHVILRPGAIAAALDDD